MQALKMKAQLYCPSFIVGVIASSLKILSRESYALDHVIYCSIVCLVIDPYFLF
jgi:hypothetical protein